MTRKKVALSLAGILALLPPPMAFSSSEALSLPNSAAAGSASPASIAPAVKVTPSFSKLSTAQALTVTATVKAASGKPTPAGTVTLTSGKFTSPVRTLVAGSFKFHLAPGRLAPGGDVLTVTYTPSAASSSIYSRASGKAGVTVTIVVPTLTANLSSASITSQQELNVKAAVSLAQRRSHAHRLGQVDQRRLRIAPIQVVRGRRRDPRSPRLARRRPGQADHRLLARHGERHHLQRRSGHKVSLSNPAHPRRHSQVLIHNHHRSNTPALRIRER